MGMFDSVMAPCPGCNERVEFQSKGGDCALIVYPLEEAPAAVLSDVNRNGPEECPKCKTVFSIDVVVTARVAAVVGSSLFMHESRTRRHVLEALRWCAVRACMPDNCGTVCLCPPCHARAALGDIDPEWRP